MAVDYRSQKLSAVSKVQDISIRIKDLIDEALQLRQEVIDNGFQPGGANGITDADLQTALPNGSPAPFPHLAAADTTAAMAAIAALDTTLAANSRTHYKALVRMRP